MSGHTWVVKNKDQAEAFSKWITKQERSGKEYTYTIKEMTRSELQNAALHAMFRRLAQALNDAGYDMRSEEIIKKDLPWTDYSIKEFLFKPMIAQLHNVKSTTKLTSEQLGEAVEALFRAIASRTGVTVPFTIKDRESL